MLKIYGSQLCPDCVKCKEELEAAGVPFVYMSISESLLFLKKFLKIREEHELFIPIRNSGKIGIPCIEREDGSITFEWDEFLK